MNPNLYIENQEFVKLLGNEVELKEFISIFDIIRGFCYKVSLKNDEYLNDIFGIIQSGIKTNEDIKLLNKLLEKYFNYCDYNEFDDILKNIQIVAEGESDSFKNILIQNEFFNTHVPDIAYKVKQPLKLRNISSVDCVKKVLLLLSLNCNNANEFSDRVKGVLQEIIFNESIADSIERLNDGFELRKSEILYHLYCIDIEVPEIIKKGYTGYREIGQQMTIDCSPERDRKTVGEELLTNINGFPVNCELHTKMKVLTSKKPDRIYFCPSLPNETGEGKRGKIYIYKITAHV